MARQTLGTITVRTSDETKDFFKRSFEASGANSQGEFLERLLNKWNEPELTIEPEIKTVTIEKQVQANEILLSLSPAQMFAVRGTILSSENFAQDQNEIIDSLKTGTPPFLYGGHLFDREFQTLWIRNIVLSKTMIPEQKEAAIRHNIAAFLVNRFLMVIIEGKISCTHVTAETLKSFIRKQAEGLKPKPVPEDNQYS